jgi:hypothetical protein
MIEQGERPGLALESRLPISIVGKRVWKNLYGNLSAECSVASAVDLAHAAAAKRAHNLVRTEARPRREHR